MEDESGRRNELVAEDNPYKDGTEREFSEMLADEEREDRQRAPQELRGEEHSMELEASHE